MGDPNDVDLAADLRLAFKMVAEAPAWERPPFLMPRRLYDEAVAAGVIDPLDETWSAYPAPAV